MILLTDKKISAHLACETRSDGIEHIANLTPIQTFCSYFEKKRISNLSYDVELQLQETHLGVENNRISTAQSTLTFGMQALDLSPSLGSNASIRRGCAQPENG
ncbi:unnamed protein product [Heterotrigona itama]|uniref:Uncharacterized protein n=1 Tax=Heterotrigona itama TaxID=395501 RepID=A0A6V7HAB9_9HYME|nr:unnamed protein product [Heterotrigona itama]